VKAVAGKQMDGLPEPLSMQALAPGQYTLKAAIGCVGIGLHTGRRVNLMLRPAPAGHGIVFRRTDIGAEIPALFDRVVDTRLCTQIGDPARPEIRVGTIEHVMAAFAGLGIDNAIVEVDGPEIPILDGSAAPLVFLIDCAGVVEQSVPRPVIEIIHPVRVEQGDSFVELRPLGGGHAVSSSVPILDLAVSIDFSASAIGRQALSMRLTAASFRRELAYARTFALAEDVDRMRAAGLALGGSLGNAVVVDGARVLNVGGLRAPTEFVRHKLLDAMGDLALTGAAIKGRFVGHRSGHALNNRLLRALFADRTAFRSLHAETAELATAQTWTRARLPAAA
jgi:UDP-3-O-[3-hydroxymyristoyl] N-acetylglucosamine deacetylase